MQVRKNRFTTDILGNEEIRHCGGWKFRVLRQAVNLTNTNVMSGLLSRRKRMMPKPKGLRALFNDIINR